MDFQVSARKWRPQKFDELIGQEHIVRTLTNAIRMNRLSHAYLFSGTRGVGKTTSARILAKALNCVNGPTPEPCGECASCREIKDSSSIDVREIDGASNNGVAEVREIIEKMQYASTCRYKVYIIDEVHMLSKSAFNALLKTLEEPPPRVVFVFATTELNKIPETILSRCQCFEFKPLSHKQIVRQLELICKQEGIQIDILSLEEIAKNATGSMRDSQSLLDQVIAYCGKEVENGSVESVLGIVGQQVLETFVDHLISRDGEAMIRFVQEVSGQGKDISYFCRDLAEYIRNLLMIKIAKSPGTILDHHTRNLDALRRQAEGLDADELQQIFTVLSRTEQEMKRSSLSQLIFEMAILRLADVRPFRKIDDMIRRIQEMQEEMPVDAETPAPSSPRPASPKIANTMAVQQEVATGSKPENTVEWEKIKQEASKKRPMFDRYLADCRIVSFEQGVLHISFADAYLKGLMEDEKNLSDIRSAVKSLYDLDVKVQLSLREPKPATAELESQTEKNVNQYNNAGAEKSEIEVVKDALDIFGGVVIR